MFLPDSSYMIAAISAWHPSHSAAADEISHRLTANEPMALAAHAAVETDSVLTRNPEPYRLPPNIAYQLVETNFIQQSEVIALTAEEYLAVLQRAAASGVVGVECMTRSLRSAR